MWYSQRLGIFRNKRWNSLSETCGSIQRQVLRLTGSSLVIEHLHATFMEKKVGITFIYFDYGEEMTSENLLRSIVAQLVRRKLIISHGVRDKSQKYATRKNLPIIKEFSELLQSESRSFSDIYIIIDTSTNV